MFRYTQKVNEKGLTALKFNERKKVKSWISGKDPLIDLIVPSSSVDMRIEDIVAVKDELGKERMEVDGEREVMLRVEHALEEDNLLDALDGLIESAFFGESMKVWFCFCINLRCRSLLRRERSLIRLFLVHCCRM